MFFENLEDIRDEIDLDDVIVTPILDDDVTFKDDTSRLLELDLQEFITFPAKKPARIWTEPSWGENYDVGVQDTTETENGVLHRCDSCEGYFIDKELYSHGCVIEESIDDIPDIPAEPSIIENIQNIKDDINNSADTKKLVAKIYPRNKKQSKKFPGTIRWMRRVRKKKPMKPKMKVEKPRTPRRLGMSERTIADVGPYICHICDKTISRESYLIIHMRRHNKEKPFACEHCKKKFVVQYDLDRHMRVHVRNKTFSHPCDMCLKPFVTKSGLKLHKEQVHNTCEYCGVTFKGESQLNLHKLTHKEDSVAVGLFQPHRDVLQLSEKDLA